MDRKRRSNIVLLSLIGVNCAALVAAETVPGSEMRRNIYHDRTTCERDYSPAQCQSTGSMVGTPGRGSGPVGGHWYGPPYAADGTAVTARGDPGSGRFGLQVATETSVRGGFGGFGRAASGRG